MPQPITATFEFPKYHKKQHEFVFCESRITCVESCPKAGKTDGLLPWLIWKCLSGGPGKTYYWLAPFYQQSNIAFERAKKRIRAGLDPSLYTISEQYKTITFSDDNRIKFLSADNESALFGEDCWALVVDEAALVSQEAWEAIRSTLAHTRGQIKLISNCQGKNNWFYRLCRQAEKNELKYAQYYRITVDDTIAAGLTTQDEIDMIKATTPHARFRELYYCEPQDMDNVNPFGQDDITACIIDTPPANAPCAYGLDLGKANDSSALVAINLDNEVCFLDSWVGKTWEHTINRVCSVDGLSTTPLLVDTTGLGDVVFESLSRRLSNALPYRFTMKTKSVLIQSLIMAIQSHQLKIPREQEALIDELRNYGQVRSEQGYVSYNATKGHDDLVIATSLAWLCKSKHLATASLLPQWLSQQGDSHTEQQGWIAIGDQFDGW